MSAALISATRFRVIELQSARTAPFGEQGAAVKISSLSFSRGVRFIGGDRNAGVRERRSYHRRARRSDSLANIPERRAP